MHGRRTRKCSTNGMARRLVVASAIGVVATAAFLPGSGLGSRAAVARGAQGIPAGLAAAIHAQLGAGAIRSSSAARAQGGPYFGYEAAVSADGTTALVGAPGVDHKKGAAYIFHVSDAGSWSSSQTPTATLMNKPGPAHDQLFGFGIALSADGTTAFVGAPIAEAGGSGLGAVYVFHVGAEDAWASSSTPTATLTVSDGIFVGVSLAVSLDGTTLVAGAPGFFSAGVAHVFHVSSEGAWASTSTPTATLSNAAASSDDEVGGSVAISGDGTTALVGDSDYRGGGGAYVYHVSAESGWTSSSTPTAILFDVNSGDYDALGVSVALSGDGTVALLGAPGVKSGTGAVDVFHTSGEAAWASTATPTATLTNAGGSRGDIFGVSVAVSADGTAALVTAAGVDGMRGAAYIFHASGEEAWASSSASTATLTASGAHAKDILGVAPALSGDGATAFVGAPGVRWQTGAVDVFHVADASSWASSSTPTAILTDSALNQCVVPRLKGLTVSAARSALRARSCRLGRVRRVVHPRAKRGHVVSQSRNPGSRWAVGARVAVKIAK